MQKYVVPPRPTHKIQVRKKETVSCNLEKSYVIFFQK